MSEIDNFYLRQKGNTKECLLALREIILSQHKDISAAWKYGMPFFCFRGKMFCYLWVHKKFHQPYLGIVEGNKINHPDLVRENRSRMKILLVDPDKNIPVQKIKKILREVISLYTSGAIRTLN